MQTTNITTTLNHLHFARYTFTLRMAEDATLPAYKGGLLRGGFGINFKRTVCAYADLPPCKECAIKDRCPYPPIFEPAPPADSQVLRTHSSIPRPFVIVPPDDERTRYRKGTALSFDLTLMGNAIESLPYFIVTFQRLGEIGLGRDHAKFDLTDVIYHDLATDQSQPIIQNNTLTTETPPPGIPPSLIPSSCHPFILSSPHPVTLHFKTPTALKYQGKMIKNAPPFHLIIRTLLRRLSSLSYFYGGQQWDIDYGGWIQQAEAVEMVEQKIQWTSRSRYSTRQQQRTDLSGFVGRVTYEGEIGPFLSLLRLGELIHVGKNAVFGNGCFALQLG